MAKRPAPAGAVIAPGAAGSADQPIVQAMAARLTALGIRALPISFSRRAGSGSGLNFARELDDLRRARDELRKNAVERIALVGRSYGGRMCTRLAALEPPDALIVLGHPISPPGRPRPDDEAALAAVRCPTFIVQGDRDRLGPLEVLQRIAARNPVIEISVLKGAGHNFGPRQAEAIESAATWLVRTLELSG